MSSSLLAAAAARPWLNANAVLPFLAFVVLAAIVLAAAVAAIGIDTTLRETRG